MSNVVISGSNAFHVEAQEWKKYWEERDNTVTKYPVLLSQLDAEEYKGVFLDFMKALEQADTLFVLNMDKNDTVGYVGPATFSEMVHAITLNELHGKHIKIIMLQIPSAGVASYSELKLWLELGWITILES